MLDFDVGGEAFDAWHQAVDTTDKGLLDRLVIEQSPSGGWHVVYRCQSAADRSLKLAQRKEPVDGPDQVIDRRQDLQARGRMPTGTGMHCSH